MKLKKETDRTSIKQIGSSDIQLKVDAQGSKIASRQLQSATTSNVSGPPQGERDRDNMSSHEPPSRGNHLVIRN